MRVSDRLYQCKSQPRSLRLARAVKACKSLCEQRNIFFRNTFACIGNAGDNRLATDSRKERDTPRRTGIRDGVFDEVCKCAAKQAFVAPDHNRHRRQVDVEGAIGVFDDRLIG